MGEVCHQPASRSRAATVRPKCSGSRSDASNVGHQLGKGLLIELVPSTIESTEDRVGQRLLVLMEMREPKDWVVRALVEKHWGYGLQSVKVFRSESEIRELLLFP